MVLAHQITSGDAAKYFNAVLGVTISTTLISYLLIYPALWKLRRSHPDAPGRPDAGVPGRPSLSPSSRAAIAPSLEMAFQIAQVLQVPLDEEFQYPDAGKPGKASS